MLYESPLFETGRRVAVGKGGGGEGRWSSAWCVVHRLRGRRRGRRAHPGLLRGRLAALEEVPLEGLGSCARRRRSAGRGAWGARAGVRHGGLRDAPGQVDPKLLEGGGGPKGRHKAHPPNEPAGLARTGTREGYSASNTERHVIEANRGGSKWGSRSGPASEKPGLWPQLLPPRGAQ